MVSVVFMDVHGRHKTGQRTVYGLVDEHWMLVVGTSGQDEGLQVVRAFVSYFPVALPASGRRDTRKGIVWHLVMLAVLQYQLTPQRGLLICSFLDRLDPAAHKRAQVRLGRASKRVGQDVSKFVF